jgi:16S rRNA (guanine1516-N2)-methyltransferase
MNLKDIEFLSKDVSEDVRIDLLSKSKNYNFELKVVDEKLTVSMGEQSYFCDFLSANYILEVKQNYSRSESVYSFLKTLSKSTGKKRLKILDMTAGFGRDLFKFVLAGHDVLAFEKDPLVFSLLQNGANRFFYSDELKHFKKEFRLENDFSLDLMYKDSTVFLNESILKLNTDTDKKSFDLIYFDPMFEDKQKKAAPKKHMQIIKKSLLDSSENIQKEDVILNCLKISKVVVLKSSKYEGKKIKPKKTFSFKGFNYYLF